MNISLDPAIMEALNTFAEKLGTTVEFLYGVMVKQARVDGVMCLIQSGIALLAGFFCIRGIYMEYKRNPYFPPTPLSIASVLGLIVAIIVFVTSAVGGFGIGNFLNPDYYALKLLFQMLGK